MTSANDPTGLEGVFHLRWTVPVMAEIHCLTPTAGGGRFVVLRRRLGIARDSLRRTVADLVEVKGWLTSNPGYGHPLRPELVFTARGRRLGKWCAELVDRVERGGVGAIAWRKWSMPILDAVARAGDRGARFNELTESVSNITPRALTSALKDAVEHGMLERIVEVDAYPPIVTYRVNRRRPTIIRLAHTLALYDKLKIT